MPRKDLLMAFARLIVSKLSHEEIDMLCIALLNANMQCKHRKEATKCQESHLIKTST